MQERRTAGMAAGWLREQGYEVTQGVGGTGMVGLLRNGEGATVLLRAEMDALPMKRTPAFLTRAPKPPPIRLGRTLRSHTPAGTTCT
jgi:hippurate hydrolase